MLNVEVWPDWETVRVIGRGSYGAVYEIRREMFGQKESAAVKCISIPQNASDIEELRADGYDEASISQTYKDRMQRITEEYSLMRKFNGTANVVSCDDIHCQKHANGIGWDIYIKMELLTALPKVLPQQIDDSLVARIGMDICRALEVCSQYNIVHRDIKPQNLFLSPNGDFKLGDFGIARTMEHTIGGTRIGTYKYMAPEIYNNQAYNRLVDIYSLGMVLYWMLNERRMPFVPLPPQIPTAMDEGNSNMRRFGGEALPPPLHGRRALKKAILKACEFDPANRYQSAKEMREALTKAVSGADELRIPCQKPEAIDGTETILLQRFPNSIGVSADTLYFSSGSVSEASACIARETTGTKQHSKSHIKSDTALSGNYNSVSAFPSRMPYGSGDDRVKNKYAKRKSPRKNLAVILLSASAAWLICLVAVIVVIVHFIPQRENNSDTTLKSDSLEVSDNVEYTPILVTPASTTTPAPVTPTPVPTSTPSDDDLLPIGEKIFFGYYHGEEIEWRVLDVDDNGNVLVISEYGVDYQPYNTTFVPVTWETCTLRSWLNNDFYNTAFDDEEEASIQTVTVRADKNPSYDTDTGNDVQDKVFLLSIEEAEMYFSDNTDRMCIPTEYELENGAFTYDSGKLDGTATCWWALRTSGCYSLNCADVNFIGSLNYDGDAINKKLVIRPAMWIDLDYLLLDASMCS